MNAETLKTQYRKCRRSAWGFMIFAVVAVVFLINLPIYREPLYLLCAGVCIVLAVRFRRGRPPLPDAPTAEALDASRELYDRVHKAALGWMFAGFFIAAALVFSALAVSVYNSKPQELVEFFQSNLTIFEILIVLIGKNILLSRWTTPFADADMHRRYRRYMIVCALLSAVWWALVLIALGIFNTASYFTFYVAAALYGGMALLFNMRWRGKCVYRNFTFSKVRLGIALAVVAVLAFYVFIQRDVWLTQPYINRVPNVSVEGDAIRYDDDTGIYTITNEHGGDFKVLQLTDIHLGGSYSSYINDLKALKACFALIDYARPDLVVVTGDLCFPMGISSFSLNNTAPVMQFAAFMRNTGIPWAFTYGNHDTEAVAATDQDSLDALYRSLSYKTSKNLLYPYIQPDIMGRNNQLIEVRNADGTLNTALFLIDSNAYTGTKLNEYDYIHDDQVDWYAAHVERLSAEAGHTVSSMAFFHIPLQQYRTAYELYEAGSDEVKWFFGSNDEKLINKVCCSDYPSNLFVRMVELGSTKATFCGHDHYNYMSLQYRGIRLTYGMSIDYLVMPGIARDTKQRGGTLITLHPDSSFDITQIPLTGIAVEA